MKNLFLALALAAELISGGMIYPATMAVKSNNDGWIQFETATGHVYEIFEDGTDWEPGDLASIIMFDPGTPDDVTDDYMLAARYSGFWR